MAPVTANEQANRPVGNDMVAATRGTDNSHRPAWGYRFL